MPPDKSFLKGKSALILLMAMVFGVLHLVLTCAAYFKGAYYQDQQAVEGQTYFTAIMNGEEACKKSFIESHPFDSDAMDECPKGVYLLVSLGCAGISLLFSIILFLLFLCKSDMQPQRWMMMYVSIGMCFAGLLLFRFLISVPGSNYPDCSRIDNGNGQTVESKTAPFTTAESFDSCESYTNYHFQHRLLIAATVYVLFSAVYHGIWSFGFPSTQSVPASIYNIRLNE